MLQPNPLVTGPLWPIAADAAPLLEIVQAQANTISEQFDLIHDYQDVLDAAQVPPVATGTGTATGTSLVMTAVTGIILAGAMIAGGGVPTGTTILNQLTGSFGSNGTYTTSVATTALAAALTFTPGGGPSSWPIAADADTLNAIVQAQTAIIRNQTALIQQYQDLLNTSETPAPPTGP